MDVVEARTPAQDAAQARHIKTGLLLARGGGDCVCPWIVVMILFSTF